MKRPNERPLRIIRLLYQVHTLRNITDWPVGTLLEVMEIYVNNSPKCRENIDKFNAHYLFVLGGKNSGKGLASGEKTTTVNFNPPDLPDHPYWWMQVLPGGGNVHPDVTVNFKDDSAFWKLMKSGGNDILPSFLANDVETDGNLNYLLRFGFLVSYLEQNLVDCKKILRKRVFGTLFST